MIERSGAASPRFTARMAGLFYLLMMLAGGDPSPVSATLAGLAAVICTRALRELNAIEPERVVDTQMDTVLTRDLPSP